MTTSKGFGNILKFYHSKAQVGGIWDEYLYQEIKTYESVKIIRRETPGEKRRSMPLIFKDSALEYFTKNVSQHESFEEAISILQSM